MWFDVPAGRRLWIVRQRHFELIAHAAENRLGRLSREAMGFSCDDRPEGIRVRLADLLISMGRALEPRRAPCNDPCPD
jgi:hypothetical protein